MTNIQLIRESGEGARASEHYTYLKPYFEAVREELHAEWLATKPAQANLREHIWRAQHAIDDVENRLISKINTGKMAAYALDRDSK